VITFLLANVSLSAKEISITNDDDPDIIEVKMDRLTYFLVTPFFMNEVEIVDSEHEIDKKIIRYYKDKEVLFDKVVKFANQKDIMIKALVISTSVGFVISIGLITGVIVYALLHYYTNNRITSFS